MPHAPRNLLCVSVLVLICDKRSETLRWVARGPLAVHRGALPVWLTGARSMKPTRSAPRLMSISECWWHCLFDVALMARSFLQVRQVTERQYFLHIITIRRTSQSFTRIKARIDKIPSRHRKLRKSKVKKSHNVKFPTSL